MANELHILYNAAGSTVYATLQRASDGKVWDGSALVTWSDAGIADYAITLTNQGGDYYAADIPGGLPAGTYVTAYYKRAGATPATGDNRIQSSQAAFYWNGTNTTTPPTGDVTVWGTRSGIEQKIGARNLKIYVFLGDTNEDPDGDPEPASIAPAINDDLTEAATDMAVAWREYTATPLGTSSAIETRWLADTNEYGAAVKAWAGRNIDAAQTQDVPQQVATAMNEWERRLTMLREGTALLDYQDAENIGDDGQNTPAGTFQNVDLIFEPVSLNDEYSN